MRPALLLLALLAAPRPAAGAPTAWSRQVPPVAPVARAFSAAVSTPSSLNVFGGLAGDALSGVPGDLAVDPLSGLPASQGAPTGARLRTSQAATCEVDTDAVPDLMGGGVAAISLLGLLEDGSEAPATTVYKYLPAAGGWAAQAITGTSFPAPRRGATAVFLRECRLGRNCVIVYGGVGRTAPNTAADACWLYFPGTSAATGGNWQICTQSGPAPPSAGGLVGHVAVASPDGLSMFVFGGTYLGTNTVSNDIFQFKVNGYLDAQSSTSEMQALLTGTGTTAVTTAGSSSLFTNNRTGATAAETRVVIDGSTSQTYVPATGAGCFVTYSDASGVGTTNPWWRADMGYPSYASFSDNNMFLVLAWMRTDAATGRNTGVSFWFSNVTDPKPWEAGGGGVQWPNPYTDPIYNPLTLWASGWPNAPVPVNARYVWAANLGTNRVLQLCELQVWCVARRARERPGATLAMSVSPGPLRRPPPAPPPSSSQATLLLAVAPALGRREPVPQQAGAVDWRRARPRVQLRRPAEHGRWRDRHDPAHGVAHLQRVGVRGPGRDVRRELRDRD